MPGVVYHEIFYSASLFNRLNGLGFTSSFNLLNQLGFIDYFMINNSWPLIIPILNQPHNGIVFCIIIFILIGTIETRLFTGIQYRNNQKPGVVYHEIIYDRLLLYIVYK